MAGCQNNTALCLQPCHYVAEHSILLLRFLLSSTGYVPHLSAQHSCLPPVPEGEHNFGPYGILLSMVPRVGV